MIFNIAGGVPAATQATPTISVNSAGLITASATQTAGYVAAGTKSATKQLTVQAAKTVTPSASAQTAVAASRYTTGAIKVAAIPSTYKRVATGTVTATEGTDVSVTGLGFTPAHVCLFTTETDATTKFIVSVAYDSRRYSWGSTNGIHVDENGVLTLSSDGFSYKNSSSLCFEHTYDYVAWS